MVESGRAIRPLYHVIEPAFTVLVGGCSTASTEFTSDRYIRIPAAAHTLNGEATCAFRSGLPEYRRKLGEQYTPMIDDWSLVVQIEALVRVVCVSIVILSRLCVECVAAGGMVDLVGERRSSHCCAVDVRG